ncbi:hypothetical protein [Mammaliicoccus phage vB_MscM-PMS3]|nr:hypothetical protein [Mammaliicoccus phage vB_MscM-PMS3]
MIMTLSLLILIIAILTFISFIFFSCVLFFEKNIFVTLFLYSSFITLSMSFIYFVLLVITFAF